MKVPAAALAVLLLVAICSLAQDDFNDSRSAGPSKTGLTCCVSSISYPIPRSMILFAYRTSSFCAVEAVIVVTRKGREVCVDPKAHWVQKYLEDF
ncbi:C-C motif chemokine 3-like [Chamaea fasciata]|uniref:C-C motif chemokine 3-like n=1 Tax=Chamaea fasciata TaxID=190680 RepID=UPI00336ADD37